MVVRWRRRVSTFIVALVLKGLNRLLWLVGCLSLARLLLDELGSGLGGGLSVILWQELHVFVLFKIIMNLCLLGLSRLIGDPLLFG